MVMYMLITNEATPKNTGDPRKNVEQHAKNAKKRPMAQGKQSYFRLLLSGTLVFNSGMHLKQLYLLITQ